MEAVNLKKWVLCLLFYPLPPPLLANFSLSKYLFGAKIPFRYSLARPGIVPPLKSQTKYHSERCANFGGFPNALKTLNLSKQKKIHIAVLQNPAIQNAEWLIYRPCWKTGFPYTFLRFSFKIVLIITKVKSSQAQKYFGTPVLIAGLNGLSTWEWY